MARMFSHTTAELVIQVVEAVQAAGKATIDLVQHFCDLSHPQAENALILAVELQLISRNGTEYKPSNPLVKFVSTPDEARKAALLRVVLESYEPFVCFRERLLATNSADTAAQHTKTLLDLGAHREDIKDTLISLGTYTSALISQGGGRYTASNQGIENPLLTIANTANDQASSEFVVRRQIGQRVDQLDRQEVVLPISNALLKAKAGDTYGAVTESARAFESYIARLAQRMDVNLTGASGIIQKLDKFRPDNKLPKKVVESAKYLGHIRNAAEHGIDVDPEVGDIWHIQESTALQYVFVTCSFITATLEYEAVKKFII